MPEKNVQYRLEMVQDEDDKIEVLSILQANDLPVSDLDADKKLFMLKQNDAIIGTAGLEMFEDCALLRSICIVKKEQGKGFGKKITHELEEIAKQNGINRLFLLTTTAKNFFFKEGYEIIQRTDVPASIKASSEFESVCPSSAVVMQKRLS